MKAEEKLDYASTINKRLKGRFQHYSNITRCLKLSLDFFRNLLKADIDFNKNHSPLVEEKLRLEQEAMTEIKKEQKHQEDVLIHSQASLKVEQEKFERKTSKINANKKKYEDKLEKVSKALSEIKNELEAKERLKVYQLSS